MNKTIAIIALSSLFTTASCANSFEQYKEVNAANGKKTSLRQCFDSAGVQVRMREQRIPNPMEPNAWGAVSTYTPMSGPLVTFHNMNNFDAGVIEFAWEHECAHHLLGHTREVYDFFSRGGYGIPAEAHEYEFAADCRAVEIMSMEGRIDEPKLQRILAQFPENEYSQTHPTTSDRLAHALTCIAP